MGVLVDEVTMLDRFGFRRLKSSRVQIERERYAEPKAYFLDIAAKRSAESLGRELYDLPFEPYAPVRQQLLNLLRLVNKARQAAGEDRRREAYWCACTTIRRAKRPFSELYFRTGSKTVGDCPPLRNEF
jgi:hypothetical protein